MKNLWCLLLVGLVACERPIDFQPKQPDAKLVVEAKIETGEFPIVYLSKSMNYFSRISLDQLVASQVTDAIVRVSDGQATHQLKPYDVEVAEGYHMYYYSVDSSDLGTAFKGVEGKSYSLIIESGGQDYSATTTIPVLASKIDSLYYEKNVDDEDTSKVVLYGKFIDPPGFGNYTRYFTRVNDGGFFPGLNSVFDDQIIDGKSYKIQIEQGVDRNSDIDFDNYSYFHRGDTITVKYCNIDRGVFDFWRTMEYSYASIGNPFSSPTRVIGNISNGALGYFGGYAVQYANVIIPE